MSPPRDARLTLSPLVLRAIALLSALALSGCSEQEFRELLLVLALGFVLLIALSVCMGIVNLTILGGGIATLAINLAGTPTERSRVWGFVFGGLNAASGIISLLTMLGGTVYLMRSPNPFDAPAPAGAPAAPPALPDDFFVEQLPTLVIMGLMACGSIALGAGGIVAASRAKVAAKSGPAPGAAAADGEAQGPPSV